MIARALSFLISRAGLIAVLAIGLLGLAGRLVAVTDQRDTAQAALATRTVERAKALADLAESERTRAREADVCTATLADMRREQTAAIETARKAGETIGRITNHACLDQSTAGSPRGLVGADSLRDAAGQPRAPAVRP